MYAVPKPRFTIFFVGLLFFFLPPAFSVEESPELRPGLPSSPNRPSSDAMQSSINSSLTLGSDKYTDSSLGGTIGLSVHWGLEIFSSTTRKNTAVVAREVGFAPLWQINENHEMKFELSYSGQDGGVASRTGGISYSVNAGSFFDNSALRSDVTLQLASTVYTIDTVQISPKESRGSLSLTQEISDTWALGGSVIWASYSEQAIQSYRRYVDRQGLSEFLSAFEAGPLELATSVFGEYQPNLKYSLRLEVLRYVPVAGAAKSTTTSLSSNRNWNEHWNTGLKLSGTQTAGNSKGSVGLSLGYLF